jgi:L-threonylcarbamoyladenylate synthase
MLMKIVKTDTDGLKTAANIILSGGIVIYPTETIYGLGCLPSNPNATKRICEIKGRTKKPLPLICSDITEAQKIVSFNSTAMILAESFWPGPLTLVLPKKVSYPIWVTRHKKTLAIRVPRHHVAIRLAQLSGGVIVSTSANKSGEVPAKTAMEAINIFGGTVDVIMDGGTSQGTIPSTVLDLSDDKFCICRIGPISKQEILKALKV